MNAAHGSPGQTPEDPHCFVWGIVVLPGDPSCYSGAGRAVEHFSPILRRLSPNCRWQGRVSHLYLIWCHLLCNGNTPDSSAQRHSGHALHRAFKNAHCCLYREGKKLLLCGFKVCSTTCFISALMNNEVAIFQVLFICCISHAYLTIEEAEYSCHK